MTLMVMAACLFATILGEVQSIYTSVYKKNQDVEDQLQSIANFLSINKSLPPTSSGSPKFATCFDLAQSKPSSANTLQIYFPLWYLWRSARLFCTSILDDCTCITLLMHASMGTSAVLIYGGMLLRVAGSLLCCRGVYAAG